MYGLGAYVSWGFIPFYFHALAKISPWVILCHRVVWSAWFLAIVISLRREWKSLLPLVKSGRNLMFLAAGSVLIAINWLVFIHAVGTNQLFQGSMGYFINPVFSIALGLVFLGERLRGWQWVAVGFATAAVAYLAIRGGGLPWIALSLAGSFGLYGLVRKKLNVNSLHGLLVETVFLVPPAVYMLLRPGQASGTGSLVLLSFSGIITAVPLLMFGAAVRRLPLSTMGFLQYVGPTLQFLVALVAFREPLDRVKLTSFILCWIAIAIYVADSVFSHQPQAVADEPE